MEEENDTNYPQNLYTNSNFADRDQLAENMNVQPRMPHLNAIDHSFLLFLENSERLSINMNNMGMSNSIEYQRIIQLSHLLESSRASHINDLINLYEGNLIMPGINPNLNINFNFLSSAFDKNFMPLPNEIQSNYYREKKNQSFFL